MTERDRPEDKIKRLMRESVPDSNVSDFAAAARKRGRSVATPKPVQVLHIAGSSSAGIIGNNNSIHINVRTVSRPKVAITPGPQHISNAQAAEIKRLVTKVVEVSGRSHQVVYNTIYRQFSVTSYLLVPCEKHDSVVQYLHKWIARFALSSKPDADPEATRKRLLKRLHTNAGKEAGLLDRVRSFVHGRFGTASFAELVPGQLDEVIRQFKL